MSSCPQCNKQFETAPEELAFIDKISPVFNGKKYAIAPSKLCTVCRQRRRLVTRNEIHLYHRKCDLTGEKIISSLSPDKPFKVYKTETWWGDDWDPMQYGRAYNPQKSFFEQFGELQREVPRMALIIANNETSPYINHCWNTKNSYMCFNMGFSQDVLYSRITYHCKDVADTLFTHDSELCYNLINCQKCYDCSFLLDCGGCTDAFFSFDCKGCGSIAFCSNLRNKSFHIFNKPVSKEEFQKFVKEMKKGSYRQFKKYINDFENLVENGSIHRHSHNQNIENCEGDYILNSKNCINCYDTADSQDVRDGTNLDEKVTDSIAIDHAVLCELCYEGQCINGNKILFSMFSYLDDADCMYCDGVMSSGNCFGCVGLKRKQYCILNKQYTREEYEKLVPQIIEQMQKDGEWGEFFPPACIPYSYNESLAQESFPLTKEQAVNLGYGWKDEADRQKHGQPAELPDEIGTLSADITTQVLACENCGSNYKLIEREVNFYKSQGVPAPRKCFACRHADRAKYRTANKLFTRACAKCAGQIQTTYAPESPATSAAGPRSGGEKVYCEKCYLKEVY